MKKKKINKNKLKGKSSFIASILNIFIKNPHRPYNYKQISSQLKVKDKASKDLIAKIMKELVAEKELLEVRTGKYKLNFEHSKYFTQSSTEITGTADMKQTGKGYVIPDEGGEDIYIAPNNTFRALNKDKVKVKILPKRKGRKTEGQIIEIIKRGKQNYVGIVEVSKHFAFVIPDSSSIHVDIFIPTTELNGAKSGDKVIAKLMDWPERSKNPFGKITAVLGKPGDNNVEMQSILAEHDFPLTFPKNVEAVADKISVSISESEIEKRRDYRKTTTITIDPLDAKDFDDALSLKKLENGNWEVGIHIADVSHYVQPNDMIDKEAFDRATSIYLVDRVIPMLPEVLSNGVCSLRPNEEKLCFAAVFELDNEAKIVNDWFGRTVINSDRRFTYEEAQEILEGAEGDFKNELIVLDKYAKMLRDVRFKNGSINFRSDDVRFNLDENGAPISVYIKEQKDANRLVEDFMLLANRKVAEFIGKRKGRQAAKTFIYRVHDQPNPEKLDTFMNFVNKLGYSFNANSHKNMAKSFNQLFKDIAGKGEETMIESIAIRTMSKAEYSTKNIGHYGLAFSHYSHFTSPIRRYPDLMTHRLLEYYLDEKPSASESEYEEKCVHCSIMERRAEQAERESIKYKQAEYMLDKIGQEFHGLISGVSKWGLYVEIEENRCEGMVRLRDLEDDFYYLDEENYQVIGQRYGTQYKLGDRVKIRVKRIDISRKQMDFEMVD